MKIIQEISQSHANLTESQDIHKTEEFGKENKDLNYV